MIRRKLFLAGCWVMVLTGALHTVGHAQMMQMPSQQGVDANETQLIHLMSTYRDAGTGRTMLELMLGFSLLFSLICFGIGILGIFSARGGRPLNDLIVRFNAVMLALMLATSLVYFFAAPSACLGVAFALFTATAVIGDRTAPSRS